MTLRLVLQSGQTGTNLALHGWLAGAEVVEFERVAAEAPLPLRIDLTNLVGADPAGIAALNQQCDRGARLANASPYIGILLRAAAGHADDAAPKRARRGRNDVR